MTSPKGESTAAGVDAAGVTDNPAVALGLLLGAAAREGRDKLTLLLPPQLEPFGLWVEQLVAESTGKNGVGVVPIAGEVTGNVLAYGHDRLFVEVRREAGAPSRSTQAGQLEAAVIRRRRSSGTSCWHSARSSSGSRDGYRRRPARDQPV
jgi:hypothetical protein